MFEKSIFSVVATPAFSILIRCSKKKKKKKKKTVLYSGERSLPLGYLFFFFFLFVCLFVCLFLSGNFFLTAPFPVHCLLVLFWFINLRNS